MTSKYICAFRGRRDDYQVPIALNMGDMLHSLATDMYLSDDTSAHSNWLTFTASQALKTRYKPDLPSRLVNWTETEFVLERAMRKLPIPEIYILDIFDDLLSKRISRIAARERLHLLAYSPHADYAFKRRYKHPINRVLFQFHPHWQAEKTILEADQARYRAEGIVFSNKFEDMRIVGRAMRRKTDDAWRLADLIVCASSFTKSTLTAVGAPEDKIVVIPYGVDTDMANAASSSEQPLPHAGFRVLFVGTGLQRKGLHHLLLAWERANLPTNAELILVCRNIEPVLEKMAVSARNTVLKKGVSAEELDQLYRTSSLFCMPSLIEGFGQVYLEALMRGLPVLGTRNTCLPDLGGEDDGIFLCETGDIDQLTASLERLSHVISGDRALRDHGRHCAGRLTWAAFRKKVLSSVRALDAAAPAEANA